MSTEQQIPEIKLDQDNLYREETFSDRRAGVVRRLTPVDTDGNEDGSRQVIFEGQTSLLTGAGSLPINFELKVGSLSEALERFPEAARAEIEQTMEELKELQRQSSSSIVTPGSQGGGGMPGGGNIQLR